jgi:aldehyde dehydrogenase (NAD+)
MNESPDNRTIEEVFAAQRKTAIALRTSMAKTHIEKLRKREAAIFANRDAITRALAADLHRSEAETEFLELLPVIAVSAIRAGI